MVNGSFVFGMDDDDETVFERTVEWAIEQGIETATFHILTPYPGTALHAHGRQGRITITTGISTTRATPSSAGAHDRRAARGRVSLGVPRVLPLGIICAAPPHTMTCWPACATRVHGGWKKFEPLWDSSSAQRAGPMLPVLEAILSEFGRRAPGPGATPTPNAQLPNSPKRKSFERLGESHRST